VLDDERDNDAKKGGIEERKKERQQQLQYIINTLQKH